VNLVHAADADLPEVIALMNYAYRGEGASWNTETAYIEGDRISLADLRDELAAKPAMQLLLWRDASALLGCVSLEPAKNDAWYLGMLTVQPGRQDQQLGRRLLAEAERVAKDLGANRIRMSVVWVRETLIAWYLRRDYALTGETAPFPYGDLRWGRPLRDDLHFVILEKPLL
jgi:GNAT superfamily N-acetyltransferase